MSELPRVLYIDDDEGLRLLTQRALVRRGYEVELAASGSEGVEMVRERPFDLVAVDHYMPGQDGLATLEALQALPKPPPVVYVTGSEESRIAVAALKAGAADYVVKTVGDDFFDLLAQAFDQTLAAVRMREEKELALALVQASNERLEALLREVNHRVANSLQLVSAFVHMQASNIDDNAAKTALQDTQRRIEAIAQVHKRLYSTGEFEVVEMDGYLAALLNELEQTWSTPRSPRELVLTAEPVRIGTDKAVAIGIIVNELVSNACKYAYSPGAAGQVRVSFEPDGEDHFLLCVQDDGCGMTPGEVRGTGLGSKLIKAMASSLKASVKYDPDHDGVSALVRAAR
jgi:two-component sensor histidine kinase